MTFGSQYHNRRRGLFLVDAAMGLVLLGLTGLLIAGLLGNLARLRRSSDVRQAALHATTNLLERLTAQPWAELQPGPRVLDVPAELAFVLPGATAEAQINDASTPETPDVRQIEVVLRWPDSAAAPRPVRLTTWRALAGRDRP